MTVPTIDDLDYALPEELIAQAPLPERDASRLLTVRRDTGALADRAFRDLPDLLRAGDVLVLNRTKVLPARLRGVKAATGARVDLLLLEEVGENEWTCLLRPGRRVRAGTELRFEAPSAAFGAEVLERAEDGRCRVAFRCEGRLTDLLWEVGETPLPPYIKRPQPDAADRERYQTVYARDAGAVAAPTAGLHFTPAVLETLRARGVETADVTLHVGLGTFQPLTDAQWAAGRLHAERYAIGPEAAATLNAAKRAGRRIVAVGTTAVRVLETVCDPSAPEPFRATAGYTELFLRPGDRFHAVDAMLTNFHLPRSSLFALVCAFAGRAQMRRAYAHAVAERYRFYSYGDATFLW